ncbi:MAG: hypothetical protein EU543_01090 [Promethearchaeota archaeon]|nr:MAG: hypothetical protein EU543_01090 [Candidatus Lokiarchaeota archaeon]
MIYENEVPDREVIYENEEATIYYEVTEYQKTIMAGKKQGILTALAGYIARSFASLFTGEKEDLVFNEKLTEEQLESGNYQGASFFARLNKPFLDATYRKFTQNTTTVYQDGYDNEQLTVIEYDEEGNVAEQRIYSDNFETNDMEGLDTFFTELTSEHSITNVDTEEEMTIEFDPSIPFTTPENCTFIEDGWGPDAVPVKYDQLRVINKEERIIQNKFEREIIIRIPNRYSLYDDYGVHNRNQRHNEGNSDFLTTGILIRPQDGQVFYTADKDKFLSGTAKRDGYYFYVDSDLNSYYDTIYVLDDEYTTNRGGTPIYTVISIGYNYDGKHDFAPYEKIKRISETCVSDFDDLAAESTRFGLIPGFSSWVYNFGKLKNEKLLFPEETEMDKFFENYKPKDHIFEIHKLVDKKGWSGFSSLFYDVRHDTYNDAWDVYRSQLLRDIAEQTFMTVTATIISAIVDATFKAIPWLAGISNIASQAAYLGVYLLLTKFFIDIKVHESQSVSRANTFFSAEDGNKDPATLNQRTLADRIMKDNMFAALIGHPGGYYSEVSGGETGNQYTAEVLVSPPRNYGNNLGEVIGNVAVDGVVNFVSFLAVVATNVFSFGYSDPDLFFGLGFRDYNLDYLLLSSELPSLNGFQYNTLWDLAGGTIGRGLGFEGGQIDYYTHHNTNSIFNQRYLYRYNTLGFLERRVNEASGGELNGIRATCVNGKPHYEFIDKYSDAYSQILPQTGLYRPVVVSEDIYTQLEPSLGHISIQLQCVECESTEGVNPYAFEMESIEGQVYKAKVPINPNEFAYPITEVTIDVFTFSSPYDSEYIVQGIVINESYYEIENGDIYFLKPLEEIIEERFADFRSSIRAATESVSYRLHVYFEQIVPDTTEETARLALAQSTQYAIMDYFNQWTFAHVSANMIGEMAYTTTLTFWSTLISAPAAYFGGALAEAGTREVAKKVGTQLSKKYLEASFKEFLKIALAKFSATKVLYTALKEVVEEIVKDGALEMLAGTVMDLFGGNDELEFWLSSFLTSTREAVGPVATLVRGKGAMNLQQAVALIKAGLKGDTNTVIAINNEIKQAQEQIIQAELRKQEAKKTMEKLTFTGVLKHALKIIPSVFMGGLGVLNLMAHGQEIKTFAACVYAQGKAKIHAFRRQKQIAKIESAIATSDQDLSAASMFADAVLKDAKKPSMLEEFQNDIEEQLLGKETVLTSRNPLVMTLNEINPNPHVEGQSKLATIFSDISKEQLFYDWIDHQILQDDRFQAFEQEIVNVKKNYKKVGFQQAEKNVINIIKEVLKNYPNELRFVDPFGVELYDPNFVLIGQKPGPNAHKDVDLSTFMLPKDFDTSLSTQEMADKIVELYDLPNPVKLFLFKDKQMHEIPLSASENHAEWLEANHHNPDTDKILVLPDIKPRKGTPKYEKTPNFVVGGEYPNPYVYELEQFIIKLGKLLEREVDLKPESSKTRLSDRELNKYLYILGEKLLNDRESFSNTLSRLNTDIETFGLSSTTLDRWYISAKKSFLNILEEKKISRFPLRFSKIMLNFDKLFYDLFDIFGLTSDNEYFLKGRLILRELAIYFHSVKDPNIRIENDRIPQLSDIVGYKYPYKFITFTHERNEPKNRAVVFKHLLISPIKYIFDKYNIDGSIYIAGNQIDLSFTNVNNIELDDWIKIIEEIQSSDIILSFPLSTSDIEKAEINDLKTEIVKIVLPFINEVLKYWSLHKALENYPNADPIYRHLTLGVLKAIGFGAQIWKAAQLIFRSGSMLTDALKMGKKPYSNTFISLKYRINLITRDHFNVIYDSDLSDYEVEIIKEKLRDTILETFELFMRGKSYTDHDLGFDTTQLVHSVIYAASLHDNLHRESQAAFYGLQGNIDKIFGIPSKSLHVIAYEGQNADQKLEKLYKKISEWHRKEYGDREQGIMYQDDFDKIEKLFAYQEALRNIYKYAIMNGYDINSLTVKDMKLMETLQSDKELVMNSYDLKYWNDKVSKAYINVFQISKFLGIDPLTFRLNPSGSTFHPHHFKSFPFRKMSTHSQDLIVTAQNFHRIYDTMQKEMGWRAGEVFIDSLMKSLEELVYLKDDAGNYREIEPVDIKRVLQKHFGGEWEYVYEGWVSEFSKGVNIEGIGDFDKALRDINERRLKYLPGNLGGLDMKGFLREEYPSIYRNHFRDNLRKVGVILSDYVTTQKEIDEYNRMFPQYKIKLKI